MPETEKNKAEYKSAVRSRRLIREAYLRVLESKSPDKITVADMVREADINRSTFYAHYKSPHDVLLQIADELVDEINSLFADFQFSEFLRDPSPMFVKFCAFLAENKETHRKLVSLQGIDIFLQKIRSMLFDFIMADQSVPSKLKQDDRFAMSLDFFLNAIIYFFRDQIAGSIEVSTDTTVSMMSYFISEHFSQVQKFLEQ